MFNYLYCLQLPQVFFTESVKVTIPKLFKFK